MSHALDVSAYTCPMTWVRTKLVLDRLAPGETLVVTCAPGSEALENVPRSAAQAGHGVVLRAGQPVVEISRRGV